MLKHEKISINISYRNISHYFKLGYSPILNSTLEIMTCHLPSTSHVKINAICEICKVEKELMYCKYLKNKSNYGYYGCKSCSRQKAAITSIERYGVDNYSKTEKWRKRVESTNLLKYGHKTNLMDEEFKIKIKNILIDKYGKENFYEINRFKRRIKIGFRQIDIPINPELVKSESLYTKEYMNKYYTYRTECRRLTCPNTKKLFESWDGMDYYDNEDISNNFLLNSNSPKYPTIDHKVSIYYGFSNQIPVEEISSIENLCITKRGINSQKRDSIEKEFIKSL